MTESTRIKKGFFWLTLGAIIQNLSKIIIIAVLSRLLSSENFGIVAVASTVIGIAELLTQISLGKSLIQLDEVTEEHIKVAFTFSLITGLVLTILFILFVNPLVSTFFGYPELVQVLNVLAFLFPIRSFSQLSFALLQRNKDFKSLAGLEAIAYIIGYGFFAIILAWIGYGVWSLVYGSLAIGVVYSALLYSRLRFQLSIGFDRIAFRDLFNFGTKYSLIKIVNYGALKGDYLVVGKILGAGSLGIYSRAYTLMDSVNAILGKVLYTLLFPFFAGNDGDSEKKARLILKIIAVTFNVILPLSVVCFIYSEQIIYLLLGDQWVEAVLIFRILVVSMLARVGYKVVSSFLLSSETINNNLFVQTLYFVLIVVGTYVGSIYFSLVGASIAVSIVLYVVFFLFIYFLLRSNKYIEARHIFIASKKGIILTILLFSFNFGLTLLLEKVQLLLVVQSLVIIVSNFFLISFMFFYFKEFFFEGVMVNVINSGINKALSIVKK